MYAIKLYIGVLCVSLFVMSCTNPLDGFVLGFKSPIDKATIRLQFSLPNEGKLPSDLKFQILGRDADKIVTNLNTKNFRISKEGILILAVSPEFVPSATNPIRLTLVAESKDYTKIIREVTFTNANNYSYYFDFVKRNAAGNTNANQLVLDVTKSKKVEILSFNNTERVLLELADNTSFLSKDNEVLKGVVDLTLLHFNSKNSRAFLPAGGVASNPIDKDNKPLSEPFDFLQTAGMVSILMSTQSHEIIKKFSTPVKVSLELSPSVINPITNKNLAEKDNLLLFSYDVDNGVWKVEGEKQVEKNQTTGKLEVSFDVSHLSYWILGWKRDICRTGPSFTIKSNLKDLDIVYYSQLIDTKTNQSIRDFYISLNNGSSGGINLIPKTTENVKFRIYDYNNYSGGDTKNYLVESIPLPLCGINSTVLDVSKLIPPKYVELDLRIACPQGKTLDEASLPSQMRIQFSEPNKNAWRDLGVITRQIKTIRTYRLQLDKKYDIRASTDGGVSWPYVQQSYLINKQLWSFKITMDQYCK